MRLSQMRLPFLYRNPSTGWLAGVCSGVAGTVGIRASVLRISFLVGAFVYPLPTVIAYAVLSLLMRERLASSPEGEPSDDRQPGDSRQLALPSARDLCHDVEQRLSALESEVTSKEFELRRRFREAGI